VTVAAKATEQILLARVARRYYEDDRSKSDIAAELGISRFRVARLLDAARRHGVVRISIHSPAGLDADLSVQLQQRFGLNHAVVVDSIDDHPETSRRRLGEVAADVLKEIVGPDDVLGLAGPRSLHGIGGSVTSSAPCPVVQLIGAQAGPDGSDIIELVRRLARANGGTPYVFYAPLVAPDAASARAMRRHPDVARAAELASCVTIAVVDIGLWQAGMSTIFDALDEQARDKARSAGVIGEISGALVDADGVPVTTTVSQRIIGVTGEQLHAVRDVISVVYGDQKAPAVCAAVRGGLVTGLVTHTGLATAMLECDAGGDPPVRPEGADAAAPRWRPDGRAR
jgi:DNA-binding transcriptional regulator LsrR (DeoR family)